MRRLMGGLVATTVQLVAALALAGPGDLDTTFGSGGRVTVPMTSSALGDVLVQPDGKIVAVGYAAPDAVVLRLLPDGTPDPDFGVAGRVVVPDSLAVRAALATDGDILVAGQSLAPVLSLFVARLEPDGTLEAGFGVGGVVTTAVFLVSSEGFEQMEVGVCGIAEGADASIAVGLTMMLESSSVGLVRVMGAVRYDAAGVHDAGFQTTGSDVGSPTGSVGVVPSPRGVDSCGSMAVDAAGGVLLAGQQIHWIGPFDTDMRPVLARLDGGGDLDAGFGVQGVAHVPGYVGPVTASIARSVAVDPSGRLVIAGDGFNLARFDVAGVPDPTFGSGGVATIVGAYPTNDVAFAGTYVLAAGRRATGGFTPIDIPFAVMRAFDDGTLDVGYGTSGVASTTFAGFPLTTASALATDAAGNAIVGGSLVATAGTGGGFALARFTGGDSEPETMLTGQQLKLSAVAAHPERRRLSLVSSDPAIAGAVVPGGDDDPRIAGATLRLRGAAGTPFDATYVLPASGWSVATMKGGVVTGWRYRATSGAIGRVVVQRGRRLKIAGSGDGLPFELAGNPAPVQVDLALGRQHHCLAFAGEVVFREGRSFTARRAPAPAVCP